MLTFAFLFRTPAFYFFDGIKAWISEMRLEKIDGRNTVKRNMLLRYSSIDGNILQEILKSL